MAHSPTQHIRTEIMFQQYSQLVLSLSGSLYSYNVTKVLLYIWWESGEVSFKSAFQQYKPAYIIAVDLAQCAPLDYATNSLRKSSAMAK